MSTTTPATVADSFVDTRTVHYGTVSWIYDQAHLHNDTHRFKVEDAIADAVKAAESKYDVQQNTGLCCQWEGVEVQGDNLEKVTAAAHNIAKVLATFDGVEPL